MKRDRTTGVGSSATVIKTFDAERVVSYAVRVDQIVSVKATLDEDGDAAAIITTRCGADLLTFASLVDRDRFVRDATRLMALDAHRTRQVSRRRRLDS